jgi:hypothetical protein
VEILIRGSFLTNGAQINGDALNLIASQSGGQLIVRGRFSAMGASARDRAPRLYNTIPIAAAVRWTFLTKIPSGNESSTASGCGPPCTESGVIEDPSLPFLLWERSVRRGLGAFQFIDPTPPAFLLSLMLRGFSIYDMPSFSDGG